MCIFDTIFLVIIMDKITIFLIRHSEQLKINTLLNNSENSQIANEKIILSVEGEKKAEALSKIKELSNLNSIWSSTYVRALATAKSVSYTHLDVYKRQILAPVESVNVIVSSCSTFN